MAVHDPLAEVKRRLHDRLVSRVDARGLGAAPPAARRLVVREEALAILREEGHILPQEALARVVNEVSDRVVGLGPIEALLRDPEVSEVPPLEMVVLDEGLLRLGRQPWTAEQKQAWREASAERAAALDAVHVVAAAINLVRLDEFEQAIDQAYVVAQPWLLRRRIRRQLAAERQSLADLEARAREETNDTTTPTQPA